MNESARIAVAEQEVRELLERASAPVSAEELAQQLPNKASHSLVRLALQRMIAHGVVDYDRQRRYSLRTRAAHGA